MKLGLLTTSFPREPGDAAGHFVLGFARALAVRGHHVTVLAPEPAEPRPLPRFDGVELRWVPYLRPRRLQRTFYGAGVPDNLRRDPRAALGLAPFTASLWRAARAQVGGWDGVVSHWAVPCALVAGALPRRPRHLAVLHSADVFALEKLPGGKMLAARVARTSDSLLFVSRALRSRFLARLPQGMRLEVSARAHVSPMGIDPGPAPLSARDRARLRAALGLDELPVVLSMGRLVPIKGVERLVEAARRQPEVTVVIAGDGLERRRLEAQAQGMPNVRFVGHLQGPAKHHWLHAADAFALPSRDLPGGRTEGTPTAMLEAMDAGLPVLASPVGGIPDVLRDGQEGVLVGEGPGTWEVALGRVARGDLNGMAARARRRAREFWWQAVAPGVEELLG